MDEELMNILSEFDQVDDSSFPDFVLNPRLGEFSDPSIMRLYLKEFRSDDPRIKIIKTGRNRESNYTRYLYKLTVWESYVKDLASDYYPGVPEETAMELLLYAADNGILDVEVPNKPRFKSSRKGKLIKKLGYDPTEGVEMDYEELDQLVQAAYEAEGEPNENINPGWRALYSLQLCNNVQIVKSLVPSIFDLGYEPQTAGMEFNVDYISSDKDKNYMYNDKPVVNLRYNKPLDDSFNDDLHTIEEDRTSDSIHPQPAVNPRVIKLGDAISMNDDNTSYTHVNEDGEIELGNGKY